MHHDTTAGYLVALACAIFGRMLIVHVILRAWQRRGVPKGEKPKREKPKPPAPPPSIAGGAPIIWTAPDGTRHAVALDGTRTPLPENKV